MDWIEPSAVPSPLLLPDLHPLVAMALFRRGVQTPEAAQAFLNPKAYIPALPTDLPGLASAAGRLEMAIRNKQNICIWGDFDVDGQTATTILFQTLQDLGANVIFHIPVRSAEGHGVNLPKLKEIIEGGTELILTCDTGITAHAAVEYANSRAVDVIITDHHDLPESLPPAAAVTDPKLLLEGHPLSTLSGSGVAYKLAEELYHRFGRPAEAAQALDLATLGLVADLARLTGDARFIVQLGLHALRNTDRLGLQTIMKMAELDPANLTETHIGFILAPRLNALGRLGDANPAVELLTTADSIRARVLATQIEGLNTQRQLLCSQVTRAAEAQIRADPSLLSQPVLVLGHPAWPGGVVGIVASRLVERYRKPAILFSTPDGEPARGSARSIEGLNITAAISAQKDLLLNYGGHPMAAGLSLEMDNLPEFTRRLARTVKEMLGEGPKENTLEIDGWLRLDEINLELANELEKLAPYGPGNEELTLATHGLILQSVTTIGRNQEHLKLVVADASDNTQTVLWWNGADEKEALPEGNFDLAYHLRSSDWQGSLQVQVELVDFHSLKGEKNEGESRRLEIIDYRQVKDPAHILETLRQSPSYILWAEGPEKKAVAGQDRRELQPADTLIIWTIPPSLDEMRAALDQVQPKTVFLLAVTEPLETPEAFLERLASLLKYAINRRFGIVSWAELEAATAQRAVTVRKGVEWLTSHGEIIYTKDGETDIKVFLNPSLKDPERASRLWAEIQSLLAETAAFRAHFKQTEKESLFKSLL